MAGNKKNNAKQPNSKRTYKKAGTEERRRTFLIAYRLDGVVMRLAIMAMMEASLELVAETSQVRQAEKQQTKAKTETKKHRDTETEAGTETIDRDSQTKTVVIARS